MKHIVPTNSDQTNAMLLAVYYIGNHPVDEEALQILHRAVPDQYGKQVWEYDFVNKTRRRRAERFFNQHCIAYVVSGPTTIQTNSRIHNDATVLEF